MSDLSTYTAVSKTPDYTGIDPHKMIAYLAEKYGIPQEQVSQIARLFVGWSLDNEDNIKSLWDEK